MAKNTLISARRGHDDFEQSPLELIAAVAGISGSKKCFTGFEPTLCCARKQLRRHVLRQTGQNIGYLLVNLAMISASLRASAPNHEITAPSSKG